MTGITFFAKMPFRIGHDRHLARVSTIIRAVQISEYLGAKLNPESGYRKDICIYVKPPYKSGQDLSFEAKSYLDVVDELGFCDLLKKHPEVSVISLSDWNYQILKSIIPNKIVNIPQQNCNFERFKRKRREVTRVGMIGTLKAFDYLPEGLENELAKKGYELVKFSKFFKREDIVEFYLGIDVQIVWRPYFDYRKQLLMNPLKIVNASSFGVPTIAYDEPVFKEVSGCYIPVSSPAEFLAELEKLRENSELFNEYSNKCLEVAEVYHIEKIARLYQNLSLS